MLSVDNHFCLFQKYSTTVTMSLLPLLTHDYILVGPPKEFLRDVSVAKFVLDRIKDHGDAIGMVCFCHV